MSVEQINVAVWLRGLANVYETDTIGGGTVALLRLLALQLAHAHDLVGSLSDDAFVQRGIASWRRDYDRAQWFMGWLVRRLDQIADSTDDEPATRALRIWNDVARPILEGHYTAELCTAAVAAGHAMRLANGRDCADGGKDFGVAFASATLWNQAAAATDLPQARDAGWATNLYVAWLTEVAHQLEVSAPGEDPTLRDRTVEVLRALAATPAALLRTIGISPWTVAAGAALLLALAWWLARR